MDRVMMTALYIMSMCGCALLLLGVIYGAAVGDVEGYDDERW